MSKVMVSLAAELLAQIDAEAARREVTRSAFIARAAERELRRRDPDLVTAAIERSRRRFEGAGPFESADLIRAERDRPA